MYFKNMGENIDQLYRNIGLNIRRVRSQISLTQEQLGKAVGLSRTSINNIEHGRQKLLIHMLFDIATVCRVTPQTLLVQQEGVTNVPSDLQEFYKLITSTSDDQH